MKCPNCGKEMESGYLRADAVGSSTLVASVLLSWRDKGQWRGEFLKGKIGVFGAKMDIEANRCALCQLILFPYVKRVKKEKKEFQEKVKAENYDYGDVEKYLR